jgi:formylglycine-generating enzyme required for sulfatase activity
MVVVPAGSYMMGSPDDDKQRGADEGPRHTVTISRPFAVSKTHVTVDQFAAFVRDTRHVAFSACNIYTGDKWEEKGSWRSPGFSQEGTHPVTCLSWKDAKAYVDWIARKTGKPYRLVTESEWEYAARGQTRPAAYSRFWFGNDDEDLCRYGNGGDQTLHGAEVGKSWNVSSCTDHYVFTAPVAQFEANAFGLYDMLGQVWQWTADCWHQSFAGAPADGSAWTNGSCDDHVVRGGSWSSAPNYLRTAQRFGGVKYLSVGIRVARTLSP